MPVEGEDFLPAVLLKRIVVGGDADLPGTAQPLSLDDPEMGDHRQREATGSPQPDRAAIAEDGLVRAAVRVPAAAGTGRSVQPIPGDTREREAERVEVGLDRFVGIPTGQGAIAWRRA